MFAAAALACVDSEDPGRAVLVGVRAPGLGLPALVLGAFGNQEGRDISILKQVRPDLAARHRSKLFPVFDGYLAGPRHKP